MCHVAQWVSRAPPYQTLPAFLNLNGTTYSVRRIQIAFACLQEIYNNFGWGVFIDQNNYILKK